MTRIVALLAVLISGVALPNQMANQMVATPPFTTTCTTSGVQLVAQNRRRAYLACVNNGSVTVYFGVNAAPTTGAGIPIVAGGNFVWEVNAPINSVYCTSASSTADVRCMEGM